MRSIDGLMRRKIKAQIDWNSQSVTLLSNYTQSYDLQYELLTTAFIACYNFYLQHVNAERFLLSWLPPRVDQTLDLRPSMRRGTRRARMWLINRASHEVSRGTNSDAINRNQRSRKDRHGKIAILSQRYSVYIVI